MLMLLNRGSGVAGLAGVRARTARLLRPFLFWRRSELAAVAARAGCPTVQDPSHFEPHFARAGRRARLNPPDWLHSLSHRPSSHAFAASESPSHHDRSLEHKCVTT